VTGQISVMEGQLCEFGQLQWLDLQIYISPRGHKLQIVLKT